MEAAGRRSYAAVLMDVQMPEMDGYEATAEIRRREEASGRRTPIIAMTANAMQSDREKAIEAGMDDFVSKPVKGGVLREVMERWIDEAAETNLAEAPVPRHPRTASGEPPLDLSVIETLRSLHEDGEPDRLRELMVMFLEDAENRLKTSREAVREEDARRLGQEARALKDSSGSMGATGLARLSNELENAGESGNLARVPLLLDALKEELGRVRAALGVAL